MGTLQLWLCVVCACNTDVAERPQQPENFGRGRGKGVEREFISKREGGGTQEGLVDSSGGGGGRGGSGKGVVKRCSGQRKVRSRRRSSSERGANRGGGRRRCECCGGDRNYSCCLPPPSASGLEVLSVVEWRMQLLLQNKPPPCGDGGGVDEELLFDDLPLLQEPKTTFSALPDAQHSSPCHQCYYHYYPRSHLCSEPLNCLRFRPLHQSEPSHPYTSSPSRHRIPACHTQSNRLRNLAYCGQLYHSSPQSMSPSMSRSPTAAKSSLQSGSRALVIEQPQSMSTSGHDITHRSPITGAAAYHPDISPACCSDHNHRYNYHHHHHHHHHHTPVASNGRQLTTGQLRTPALDPAETIDPRFTPTCPCGGRLLRSKSVERLCRAGGMSSDEGEAQPTATHWKGSKSKKQKEQGARRKKEGKGKMRRFVEFAHLSALFRPKKVR